MKINYLIKMSEVLKGCDKGMKQLKESKSGHDLVKTFFDRIDFCLSQNFPSNDFFRENPDLIKDSGIIVDKKLVFLNPKKLALLGKCDVEATFTDYAVSRLYVKHDSILIIKASGNAFVMIDALDTAKVHVTCSDTAKVVVNLYSKAVCSGNATKTVQKNKETYEL